jgi:hypothetical protein
MCTAYDNVGADLPMYLLATEIIGYGGVGVSTPGGPWTDE